MTKPSNRIGPTSDAHEPRLIAQITDARQHRHVYVYYRRNVFATMSCVHRHCAEGRLTMNDVHDLLQQILQASNQAG